MDLEGQHTPTGERGYAMAGLLVALAVMAVMMSAVLPAWRHQARREKEAELVFRGEQYVRAIGLWERKMGPGARPPSIEILVQQRFLRKKYKDPMTEDGEFQPIFLGTNTQNPAGRGGQPPGPAGRGGSQPPAPPPQITPGGSGGVGPGPGGGLQGVVSKSKETSIRLYKNRNHYNEWQFLYAGAGNAGGSATPGGRGGSPRPGMPGGERGRGTGPGSRGVNPGVGFPQPTGPPRGRGPGGT